MNLFKTERPLSLHFLVDVVSEIFLCIRCHFSADRCDWANRCNANDTDNFCSIHFEYQSWRIVVVIYKDYLFGCSDGIGWACYLHIAK